MPNRKTLKVTVEELVEVNVDGIALVKHGANRIPIRITKHDTSDNLSTDGDSMKFNLKDLFKSVPQTPDTPVIVGALLSGASSVEGYRDAFKAAGVTVIEHVPLEDQDAHFLRFAEGLDKVESGVIKVDDNLALIVTGLNKSMSAAVPDTNSFMENMERVRFYPSMSLAMGILDQTVQNISASDNDGALLLLDRALSDFREYVVGLARSAPPEYQALSRIDVAPVSKSEVVAGIPDAEFESFIGDVLGSVRGDAAGKSEEVAALEDAEPTEKVEKQVESGEHGAVQEQLAKTEDDAVLEKLGNMEAKVAEAFDSLVHKMAEQEKQIAAVQKTVGEVSSRVDNAEVRVKKTEEDLRGTVPGGGEHLGDGHPADGGTKRQGIFDNILPLEAFSR